MRTRSLAQTLIESGHVRLNRVKVLKPGHNVVAGDVLTINLDHDVKIMRVSGFALRRGGASDARRLYDDLSAGAAAPEQKPDAQQVGNC